MTAPTQPQVTFWGAARTVTGSMHLVIAGRHKLLLDCGLYQGRRSEARRRNQEFPFPPHTIDAVILSHAHIDHCGNLPNLVKRGFSGPIYCTPATKDLTAVMLADSGKIQEEDAAYLNRQRPPGEPRVEPLYTQRDVVRTMRLARPVPYEQSFDINGDVQIRFVEAGHLLGSAMVALRLQVNGKEYTLTFTGDLGRKDLPILRNPAPVPPARFVISEATYGGRTHPPLENLEADLGQVVRRTLERGGKVLVPAFSLGRTQTIIYALHRLIRSGQLWDFRIYVDSPLAADATEVFRLHPECFDDDTAMLLAEDPDLFGRQRVRYVRSVQESKELNGRREPCVIIAASGMCEAGRIQHHLKQNIEDARNTVLIAGYQALDTLGRRLVERQPEVRIHDRMWRLNAEVVVMNGFSSHADHPALVAALAPLAQETRQLCLVHADLQPAQALAADLAQHGFANIAVPDRGETFAVPE
jgi:metallo-beta-lactamase family protein